MCTVVLAFLVIIVALLFPAFPKLVRDPHACRSPQRSEDKALEIESRCAERLDSIWGTPIFTEMILVPFVSASEAYVP